jgi:DNA invertase Pin-like site-specific DNA recombinase
MTTIPHPSVALYAHVSTRDKGQDTENQLAQLRQFAFTQSWTIACEYVHPKAARNVDRDQFQQLFRDASENKFDLVLFWSLNRFSRKGVLSTLQHLERLTYYGVGSRSLTEQYLDSCGVFKDAVLSIFATIAKRERLRLSGGAHAGLARSRHQGRVGGRPRVAVSHARILELYQAGSTLREIAEEMGTAPATVMRILKSHRPVPPAGETAA